MKEIFFWRNSTVSGVSLILSKKSHRTSVVILQFYRNFIIFFNKFQNSLLNFWTESPKNCRTIRKTPRLSFGEESLKTFETSHPIEYFRSFFNISSFWTGFYHKIFKKKSRKCLPSSETTKLRVWTVRFTVRSVENFLGHCDGSNIEILLLIKHCYFT